MSRLFGLLIRSCIRALEFPGHKPFFGQQFVPRWRTVDSIATDGAYGRLALTRLIETALTRAAYSRAKSSLPFVLVQRLCSLSLVVEEGSLAKSCRHVSKTPEHLYINIGSGAAEEAAGMC